MRSFFHLFFVLLAWAKKVGANTPCEEGWYYSLDLHECYYVSSNSTTFGIADTFCQDIGGELVSIYSETEYYTVSVFMDQEGSAEPFWIGLKNVLYYPYFRWLDDTNANYTHWLNDTHPAHNDTSACFAWLKTSKIINGWFQADCQNPLPFICKQHPTSKTVTWINGTSGTVSSPNYPAPYYAASKTVYNVFVPDGYLIDLSFNFIGIDFGSFVYVYDNDTLVDTITKATRPHSIKSVTNLLTIEFDASKEGNERYIGWTAKFNAFVPISTEGTFTSPNYPNYYTNNENITRSIRVPDGFGIAFAIWDFESEDREDSLVIRNGSDVLCSISGPYPNGSFPITFTTAYSSATMYWQTDSSNVDRGFNLTWVANPWP